jgi:branched-subunit amino acid transport protein
MTTGLVPLAVIGFLVTYPFRAVPVLVGGVHRLPPVAQAYIRLLGPSVLMALAAAFTFLGPGPGGSTVFHVGIEWLAVAITVALLALRRGLLLALVASVAIVAIARAVGAA